MCGGGGGWVGSMYVVCVCVCAHMCLCVSVYMCMSVSMCVVLCMCMCLHGIEYMVTCPSCLTFCCHAVGDALALSLSLCSTLTSRTYQPSSPLVVTSLKSAMVICLPSLTSMM